MAHLQFDTNLSDTLRINGDLNGVGKWKRKPTDNVSLNNTCNENSFADRSVLCPNTPHLIKNPHSASFLDAKSPGRGKSPGRMKSPSRQMPKLSVRGPKTPSRKSTPHSDRFIPNRSTTDMELSHNLLLTSMDSLMLGKNSTEEDEVNLQQKEYTERMAENLNDGQATESRILSFTRKAPQPKDGYVNNLKVLYSAGKTSATKAASVRHIPSVPEKVLDAPELLDDYYLHLLDWSANNHLAVALASSVYIWNAGDGTITSLAQLEEPDLPCSLSWIKEGHVVAIGLGSGLTQLWDVGQQKMVRSMGTHTGRVTSLSWNAFILSSGSRSGQIFHHDVRVGNHHVATLSNHTQEVCGLKWSVDGRYLASGGNDNVVNIWENMTTTPLHNLTEHQAAVKGIAWCPTKPNLLATGGGTNDRSIRIWNATSGAQLSSVITNSQVSSLIWSPHYNEIISGHGYVNNQLTLWKYPTMAKITDLTGHTGRVLELCLSPDSQMVVSAAADETIRVWKCWGVDPKEKKLANGSKKGQPVSALTRIIR